jgi:hypothetical protein
LLGDCEKGLSQLKQARVLKFEKEVEERDIWGEKLE